MKLTTIWTLRYLPLTERLTRTRQWFAMTAAHHIPKPIKYWAFIQVGSKAMSPNDIVPEVRFMDLLKNAEGGPK